MKISKWDAADYLETPDDVAHFINAALEDGDPIVVKHAIGTAARSKGMATIAEGVETAEQGRALMRLGCDNAQGYYFSKPVDLDAATDIIGRGGFAPIDTLRDL